MDSALLPQLVLKYLFCDNLSLVFKQGMFQTMLERLIVHKGYFKVSVKSDVFHCNSLSSTLLLVAEDSSSVWCLCKFESKTQKECNFTHILGYPYVCMYAVFYFNTFLNLSVPSQLSLLPMFFLVQFTFVWLRTITYE